MKGILFVLSGPSGTGKGTVCKELLKHDDISLSVSATTRECREGEIPGETYYYVTKEEFRSMISEGEMLEYAEYGDNYYGTPKRAVETLLDAGRDVLLEIEPQGALQVKELFPDSVLVFLVPPSMKELKKRLVSRGREGAEEIQKRLNAACWELLQAGKYNTMIINDDLCKCVSDIIGFFNVKRAERKHLDSLVNEKI